MSIFFHIHNKGITYPNKEWEQYLLNERLTCFCYCVPPQTCVKNKFKRITPDKHFSRGVNTWLVFTSTSLIFQCCWRPTDVSGWIMNAVMSGVFLAHSSTRFNQIDVIIIYSGVWVDTKLQVCEKVQKFVQAFRGICWYLYIFMLLRPT